MNSRLNRNRGLLKDTHRYGYEQSAPAILTANTAPDRADFVLGWQGSSVSPHTYSLSEKYPCQSLNGANLVPIWETLLNKLE
jgi:hypothetical protein